jgi:hypothetical protein
MARPLNPTTALPIFSISSRGGAEGMISPSLSDEDGFTKPEWALDASDSSESEEEEESELLESDVSGPLLLASMSNGLESSDSASDESESSDSVPDDSESSGSASGGPKPSDSASDGSESLISGSGEPGSQDSEESVSLSLSEEPGENSEPPSGAFTGAEPPVGQPALSGHPPQSPLMRLGSLSQAQSARWMAAA